MKENWIRVHLSISPLGTLVVTWLLLLTVDAERWWESRENLELAGQTVPFGGIIYGTAILFVEVSVRMLWMLATRKRDMDTAREVGREEGREEGREAGREEGREVGREEGREEVLRDLLARGVEIPADILNGAGKDKRAG